MISCGPAAWADAERAVPLYVTATPSRNLQPMPDASLILSTPAEGAAHLVFDAALVAQVPPPTFPCEDVRPAPRASKGLCVVPFLTRCSSLPWQDVGARWAERLARIFLAKADVPLSATPLMGRSEAFQCAIETNQTARPYPNKPKLDSVAALFYKTACEHPHERALFTVGGGEGSTLTYGQLDQRTKLLVTTWRLQPQPLHPCLSLCGAGRRLFWPGFGIARGLY
eukprot:1682693-Prymnesium_polylepis.2